MKNKEVYILFALLVVSVAGNLISCSENYTDEHPAIKVKHEAEKVADFDGNIYSLVSIEDQVWMKENLNVSHFLNGEPILHVTGNYEWFEAGENGVPAWRYPKDDPALGKKYGKLYNGFALNDPRGLAPEGWKVPDNKDWEKLLVAIGGEDAGSRERMASIRKPNESEEKEVMLGYIWKDIGKFLKSDFKETKEAGSFTFMNKMGGKVDRYGNFYGHGETGYWWIYPDNNEYIFMSESISNDFGRISLFSERDAVMIGSAVYKQQGFSVRLIKK